VFDKLFSFDNNLAKNFSKHQYLQKGRETGSKKREYRKKETSNGDRIIRQ